MPPLVFADFETRSLADVEAIGGRRYAEHPSTEVLCCGFDVGGVRSAWIPGMPAPTLPDPFLGVAHNAIGFDRHVWRKLGWPEPQYWIDTTELARNAGYPMAKLEWLAEKLLGRAKDMAGNKLTLSLSHVSKKTGKWPDLTPAILGRVVTYCLDDIDCTVALWPFLSPFLANDLPGLVEADRAINDRGVYFDADLARMLVEVDARLDAAAVEAAGVPATVLRSVPQLKAAFLALGVVIENAQRPTMEALLSHSDPRVVAMARARMVVSTIAAGKCEAGLARVGEDSRLRDCMLYHKAHTGRFAGQGMQTQNLTIGATGDDVKAFRKDWAERAA